MLNHTAIGPDADGMFSVAYPTPGTGVLTCVCKGCTKTAANIEAARLNAAQLAGERTIRADHQARGVRGVYPGLKA